MFTVWLNPDSKKTVYGVETRWLSGKEIVQGTALNKEGHADSLLGYERIYYYWFPVKGCINK